MNGHPNTYSANYVRLIKYQDTLTKTMFHLHNQFKHNVRVNIVSERHLYD